MSRHHHLDIDEVIDRRLLQVLCDGVARTGGISCTVMVRDGETLKRAIRPINYSLLCGGDEYEYGVTEEDNPNMRSFRQVPGPSGNVSACAASDMGCGESDEIISSSSQGSRPEVPEGEPGYWRIYRCHAGIVDLFAPIMLGDSSGKVSFELARFSGGQVILNAGDIKAVHDNATTRGIEPEHGLESLLWGFRLNRTRDITDLVAIAQLLANAACAISELFEADGGQRLGYNSENQRRVLCHAIKRCFAVRFGRDGTGPSRVKTRLFLLDPNTNLFRWTTHRMQSQGKAHYEYVSDKPRLPYEDGDEEQQWTSEEVQQVDELLWRVFKSRETLWATVQDRVCPKARGCYLPVFSFNSAVLGALQVVFPKEGDELLAVALHQDETLRRTADFGARVLSRCMETEETTRILVEELTKQKKDGELADWLKRATGNILLLRGLMDKADAEEDRARFWYLCLHGLTHEDGFSYNRVGAYVVRTSGGEDSASTWWIDAAFGIGDFTRRAWHRACATQATFEELLNVIRTERPPQHSWPEVYTDEPIQFEDEMGKVRLNFSEDSFGYRDYDRFKNAWMRPNPELLKLMVKALCSKDSPSNGDEDVAPSASCGKFEYDLDRARCEDKDAEVPVCSVKGATVYYLRSRRLGTGELEHYFLYTDDAWTTIPDPKTNRRMEELEALGNAYLMPRFVLQTASMLERFDLYRDSNVTHYHNLLAGLSGAKTAFDVLVDTLDGGETSIHLRSLGQFLKMERARADLILKKKDESPQEIGVDLGNLLRDYCIQMDATPVRCDLPQEGELIYRCSESAGAALESCLVEMLTNAQRWGGVAELELSSDEGDCDGRSWTLSMWNRSLIPRRFEHAIMQPGFSLARVSGGGRGLTLVRNSAEKHGWKFTIENDYSKNLTKATLHCPAQDLEKEGEEDGC